MLIALHILVQVVLIVRVLLRPHRDPPSRFAWIIMIAALPFAGAAAYLLLGETNIGRKRVERMKVVLSALPGTDRTPGRDAPALRPEIPQHIQPLFSAGRSVNGFEPVGSNRAQLTADADAAIDAMVADIESATDHVHLLTYIWLPDNNGTKMVEALKRAAARGVTCRAMVDDIGSRSLIRSGLWTDMGEAGIKLARALPVGNPLLRIFEGRIDIRNHRKILVIDNRVTYCGSQNCADPAFLPKAKYAPWVDLVVRFDGPITRQNQCLFAADWMAYADEDLTGLLRAPMAASEPGFAAQVVASGPTERYSAMPEMFETLIYRTQRELFITTPYFVPVESMQSALCAAANRGVDTTVVFPARNDDFAVAAASRSYYRDLLAAGVKIHEYEAGLLHTKSLTMDGEITLIGSANMDRRSFDLNYENNILLYDQDVTAQVRDRQESYLADCRRVTAEDVAAWPLRRQLWNNTLAIIGLVL